MGAASDPSVCCVRGFPPTKGPACSTVHPTSVPSSTNTCVMPSLIPRIPLTAIFLVSLSQHAFPGIGCVPLLHCVPQRLNLHVHARFPVHLHHRIPPTPSCLHNIH